ncbi:DAK2 domain-containing protein [Micrococcus sp. 2A]|uniref:DAK2 domain-containing protein n=1 Tax=Micrococcus sp. 2A TaxID=3142261 RepID=UPI0031BAA1D5
MSTPSGPTSVERWLVLAEDLVGRAAPRLNALNVFPVPDADTGSNMLATLRAARAAAESAETADVGAVMARVGRAALDAAHGNSGTLLAVALAGASGPLRGRREVRVADLAAAFGAADEAARAALSEPQEGTILTVLTAAAESLERSAAEAPSGTGEDSRLADAVTAMVAGSLRAVEGTEALLPMLADAHVVDAGAVGLLWVLEALRSAVTGTEVDAGLAAALHGYADESREAVAAPAGHAAGAEVMGTLALTPLDAAELRRRLDAVGDSLILAPVSRELDEQGRVPWRVHVHVPRAEDAVDVLRAAGEPAGLSVTDLSAPAHAHRHEADGRHGR